MRRPAPSAVGGIAQRELPRRSRRASPHLHSVLPTGPKPCSNSAVRQGGACPGCAKSHKDMIMPRIETNASAMGQLITVALLMLCAPLRAGTAAIDYATNLPVIFLEV